ncbi:Uncharacterized protein APZ42_023479 [Daphnia magna]|uniref:Uncharacterized protein n=1 Tax=Daphnia magna TaxID=35525 RepID=A0A164UX39_9CRUS|nr:Uncharacterized protein APZ42_023479 [Daphnia magna]
MVDCRLDARPFFLLFFVNGDRNHGRRGERQPLHLVHHGDGVHQLLQRSNPHTHARTHTKGWSRRAPYRDTHRERERERRTKQLFKHASSILPTFWLFCFAY